MTGAPAEAPTYGSTSATVGFVVTVGVLLLVVAVVYYLVIRVERRRDRRARDAANRNPVNCSCQLGDRCDADRDWDDYVDYLRDGVAPLPRPLCLPCLYRPHGSVCYAAFLLEWGAR